MTHHFGLEATGDPLHWRMTVGPTNITPGGSMQGGVGLGVAVDALEETTGRQAIWSTGQYLAYANPPGVVDIKLSLDVVGHNVTQASATVSMGDTLIFRAMVALGSRDFSVSGTPLKPPNAKPREESRFDTMSRPEAPSMFDKMVMHVAQGRSREELDGKPGVGQSIFYVRIADGPRLVRASDVAAVGDMMPMCYFDAFGVHINGNSIDNTVRFGGRVVTEWILLDCHALDLQRGFAHGLGHMWADDGTYLGTASQSTIMRHIGEDGTLVRSTPRRSSSQ